MVVHTFNPRIPEIETDDSVNSGLTWTTEIKPETDPGGFAYTFNPSAWQSNTFSPSTKWRQECYGWMERGI